MFDRSIDDRLSLWAELRVKLEDSNSAFQDVIDFWRDTPFIPYNNKIDPYFQQSWPTPWEIIVTNKYDDFTKALMMAYSLKYTKKFNKSVIEIRTCIDKIKNIYYNIVCVDNEWILNYIDNDVVLLVNFPESFLVENLIEVHASR